MNIKDKNITQLLKNGAKLYRDVIIKHAKVHHRDTYDSICLTLNQDLIGTIIECDEENEQRWVLGETNKIWILKDKVDEYIMSEKETKDIASYIIDDDETLETYLCFATADILQESVKKNSKYIDPFKKNAYSYVVKHDSIFNHIINLKPGNNGVEVIQDINSALKN